MRKRKKKNRLKLFVIPFLFLIMGGIPFDVNFKKNININDIKIPIGKLIASPKQFEWIHIFDKKEVRYDFYNYGEFENKRYFLVDYRNNVWISSKNYKIKYTYYDEKHLITDQDFLDQDYNFIKVIKFLRMFKNNCLNAYEISYIYSISKKYNINILVVFAKLEQEQQLIKNETMKNNNTRKKFALGYHLGKYYGDKEHGFEKQISGGISCLRKHFDNWHDNKGVKLYYGYSYIVPGNKASYALYKYTPYYGWCIDPDTKTQHIGNYNFFKLYHHFKEIWKQL